MIKAFSRDLSRVLGLLAIVAVLLLASVWMPKLTGEAVLAPLASTIAITAAVAAFSHLNRRLLFPRLDLQDIARTACGSPAGAGLVFIGICGVLAVIINGAVSLLR